MCSACTDRTCLGTTWSEAMGQCTCHSHLAGGSSLRPAPGARPVPFGPCWLRELGVLSRASLGTDFTSRPGKCWGPPRPWWLSVGGGNEAHAAAQIPGRGMPEAPTGKLGHPESGWGLLDFRHLLLHFLSLSVPQALTGAPLCLALLTSEDTDVRHMCDHVGPALRSPSSSGCRWRDAALWYRHGCQGVDSVSWGTVGPGAMGHKGWASV